MTIRFDKLWEMHRFGAAGRVFAFMDHIVSFRSGRSRDEARSPGGEAFIVETRAMAAQAGIHLSGAPPVPLALQR